MVIGLKQRNSRTNLDGVTVLLPSLGLGQADGSHRRVTMETR